MMYKKIKFILSIILLIGLSSVNSKATRAESPKSIPLERSDTQVGRKSRMPTFNPITCFYDDSLNSIIVSFEFSAGTVSVSIENRRTGETQTYSLDSFSGPHLIHVGNENGSYSITFTPNSGVQYYGEFEK